MAELDQKMDNWNGTPRDLFDAVISGIRADMGADEFRIYCEPLELVKCEGDLFTISSPARTRGWCVKKLTGDMKRLLKRELGRNVGVWFVEQVKTEAQIKMFSLPTEREVEIEPQEMPY